MPEDIEELKEKKMGELKQKLLERKKAEEEAAQAEAQLESVLRTALSTEAKARLGNVMIVNRGLYLKAAQAIVYLFQNGKLSGKIQDNEMRLLLERLSGRKPEFRIVRKGKSVEQGVAYQK